LKTGKREIEMDEFITKIHEKEGVVVLALNGILDAHTTGKLEEVFEKLISENKFKLVVDFSELRYISSAGLGVFMAYVETMRENSGDIKFAAMKENVYNVFDLLGFPVLYEFYDDVEKAEAKYREN
jgi:anti-sigma B factor antagonist